MDKILTFLNTKKTAFYDWLFSYPEWQRNLMFLLILIFPGTLIMAVPFYPQVMGMLYALYLLFMIAGFVNREK